MSLYEAAQIVRQAVVDRLESHRKLVGSYGRVSQHDDTFAGMLVEIVADAVDAAFQAFTNYHARATENAQLTLVQMLETGQVSADEIVAFVHDAIERSGRKRLGENG